MPLILIDALTLQNWRYSDANVELRIDVSRAFTASDGSPLQPGDYVAVPCTPHTDVNTLDIASFHIYSTTDGQDIQSATYKAKFCNSLSGAKIADFANYQDFAVPYSPTENNWGNLANRPPSSDRPDFTQWIRGVIDMLFARQVFVDGDTTPSIAGFYSFGTNNSATTNITTFDNPYNGKVIYLLINDSHTSVFGIHYGQGTFLMFSYDGTQWQLLNPVGGSGVVQPTVSLVNDSITGTTANRMVKLSGGNAVIATTSDVAGLIGPVVSGAGMSGSCAVAVIGSATIDADGAVTAGNYAVASTTAGGKVHDGGSSRPTTGQTIGRFLQTASGAQAVSVLLFPPEIVYGSGGGGGGTPFGLFSPIDYGAVGDGTTNDTTAFLAMLTAIGSITATVILPRTSGPFLLGNITFPPNVTLDFFPGGAIKMVTGRTALIQGKVIAQPNQIFFNADSVAAGQGEISFGNGSPTNSTDGFTPQQTVYYVEWWGAIGDNVTPSAAHMNAAFLAWPNGTTMRMVGKFYYCEIPVVCGYKFQCTLIGLETRVGIGNNSVTPILVYQGAPGGTVLTLTNVYASTFRGFGVYTSNGSGGRTNEAALAIDLTYTAGGNPGITSHCYLEAIFIYALNNSRTDWAGIRIRNAGGNNEQHTIRECNIIGDDALGTHQVGISLEQTQVQRVIIDRCSFSGIGIAVDIQGNIMATNNIFSQVGTAWHIQSGNNNCIFSGDDAEVINNIVVVAATNGQLTLNFRGCKYNSVNTHGDSFGASPINNTAGAALTFDNCTILSAAAGQDFGPYFISGPVGDPTQPVMFNNCYIGTSGNYNGMAPGFATCATTVNIGNRTLKYGGTITTGTIAILSAAAPTLPAIRDLITLPGPTATFPPDPVTIGGAIGIAGLFPPVFYSIAVVGAPGVATYHFSVIAVDSAGRRSALPTQPNGDHFLAAGGANATLTGSNYISLSWYSMFPAPDHYEVYDVNPGNSAQWRFVANVAPVGTGFETYNITANPAGSYVSTQPLFNEAGLVNFRNLVLFPNEVQFADGAATPSIAVGNDFYTANSAPTTITNFTNPTLGQIIRVRINDANTTIASNSTIITGTGLPIVGVQGAEYYFAYRGTAWHGTASLSRSEVLLATIAAVDLNTATPTTLFTVPTGRSCVITKIVVRNASINLTTVQVAWGFVSATFNDWQTAIVLTQLTTSANFRLVFPLNGALIGTSGQAFKTLNQVLQGAAATATMELFGYLI